MPKKDTAASVLGMLSSAGAQHRPPPALVEPEHRQDRTVVDLPPQEASLETHVEEHQAARTPTRHPRRATSTPDVTSEATSGASELPEVDPPVQLAEVNAPRTHRFDQKTANNLRAGWLAARRRGEVTISQQEYAGRIIALGLAAEASQLAAG